MPTPYMNPYYYQNNSVYQPVQTSPTQAYQDRLYQLQQQMNQQVYNQMPQMNQAVGLNGEIVDSIDVVNAKNVDMTGAATYYPKSDGTEIYTKQLQPDGRSRTLIYRLVPEDGQTNQQSQPVTVDYLNQAFSKFEERVLAQIKAILPEPTTKSSRQSRGGNTE